MEGERDTHGGGGEREARLVSGSVEQTSSHTEKPHPLSVPHVRVRVRVHIPEHVTGKAVCSRVERSLSWEPGWLGFIVEPTQASPTPYMGN